MRGRSRSGALVVAAGLTLLVAVMPVARAGDGNAPGLDECDWTSFRNGPANPGATSCDGIGVTNVATLLPRFLYRTRDSVTSTPAVVDGMLYAGSWDGTFYAFDTSAAGVGDPSFAGQPFVTVEPAWTFQIDDTNGVSFGRIVSSPTVADIGSSTRAVIFAGGATVYALDAADGSLLAQLCLDPRSGTGRCAGSADHEIEVESSPVVVPHPDGSVRILIGLDTHNAPGIGRSGVVKLRLKEVGQDQWSLTPEWKFDPEARVAYDEAGEGPDFLTHLAGTGDGCGGVWGTPAVDVARDLVVFGTGSCNRAGVTDTEDVAGEKVYAVRYSDGSERWRFNPPRPWGTRTDDDFGASPQLFEVELEPGADPTLVAGAGGKDGWYYAIRAVDGEGANERAGSLLWATQVGQPGHLDEGFSIGGVLGSPAVGMVHGRPALFVSTAISTPVGAPLDQGTLDSLDTSLAEDPGRMLSIHALDAATGAVLWWSPLTRQTYGHPTYANGLVFVASTVGLAVDTYDADTGLPVWRSTPLNGAPSSGIAVTHDGIYLGAGTRQTDAGFKIQGDDSMVPAELQSVIGATPVADLVGADPQERLSGIWGFRLGG